MQRKVFSQTDVTGHAMTTVQQQTTVQKNEQKSPSFAKSKEKQRHPQANAKLLHICFCPYAPRLFTTSFYF